jgi:hypothetical protein
MSRLVCSRQRSAPSPRVIAAVEVAAARDSRQHRAALYTGSRTARTCRRACVAAAPLALVRVSELL